MQLKCSQNLSEVGGCFSLGENFSNAGMPALIKFFHLDDEFSSLSFCGGRRGSGHTS